MPHKAKSQFPLVEKHKLNIIFVLKYLAYFPKTSNSKNIILQPLETMSILHQWFQLTDS